MPQTYKNGVKLTRVNHNNVWVKKWYHNNVLVYAAEETLSSMTVNASGGPPGAGSFTYEAVSASGWNLSEFASVGLTTANSLEAYYWSTPGGSITNGARTCLLRLADGTDITIGTGTKTVSLSGYSAAQKRNVRLVGTLAYSCTDATNSAFRGSVSATGVVGYY